MDAMLKARWCAALRSGEYKQDTGKLKTPEGWCCLGVLADVTGYIVIGNNIMVDGVSTGYQPLDKLTGVSDLSDIWECNDGTGRFADLKHTFDKIADYIEETL